SLPSVIHAPHHHPDLHSFPTRRSSDLRAKALGKDRHEIFDAAMHEQAMSVLKLETDLRRAIERQEFLLHYQPIVSLTDGSLRGRSEEHTSELQSQSNLVCRLLLEKKKK